MKFASSLALALLVAGGYAPPAIAQDKATMQKWAGAKIVKYRVEGVHKARAPVVHGDYDGKAEVTDRVTVEFNWDVKKGKVMGAVTIVDGKSEVRDTKSDGTNCGPPQLKGEYEHFQSTAHVVSGDQIEIKGTRTFPPASVSNYPASCSMRAVPGAKQEARLWIAGVGPEVLAMPNMAGGPVSIAADRKTFALKGAENWVWTYTPTLVQ